MDTPDEIATNTDSWGNTAETLFNGLKSLSTMAPADETSFDCPYCAKAGVGDGRFCQHCAREITPFIPLMQSIRDLQAAIHKPAPEINPFRQTGDEVPGLSWRIKIALSNFVRWRTLNATLLFCLFSYLCLFGTGLAEHKLGAYILIAATFGISFSLGKSHASGFPGTAYKSYIFSVLGGLYGCLLVAIQFGMQMQLTDNFMLPEGRGESYEIVNAILGITFAYLSGAMLNDTLPEIHNMASRGKWLGRIIVRYRQSLLPLTLFAVTAAPKILNSL